MTAAAHTNALSAHLRDEGGVVGLAPPLLGAARAPQGFLADTGVTAAAAMGLMLVPGSRQRQRQSAQAGHAWSFMCGIWKLAAVRD